MSVGLSDLDRKRKPSARKNKVPPKTGKPAARPWDSEGLTAHVPQGTSAALSDAVMNNEWLNLEVEPIFWIDLQNHFILKLLNEQLADLESVVQKFVWNPVVRFKAYLRGHS
jgi:hypothetical protein